MISLNDLKEKMAILGIPAFRAGQVYHAVCKEGKNDYRRITTLPEPVKRILSVEIPVYSIFPEKTIRSPSGDAEKILFRLRDGICIETVVMKFSDGRNSVCVSSQAGCRLGCKFCATGAAGFSRTLDYEEIFDQVLVSSHLLLKEKRRVTNVVYMGMGEPFMNYENVIKSVRCLNDPAGLNIGARSITLSTSGICEGIDKLADENLQVNLAVSLHAPNQHLRETLMPVAKICNLKQLMNSIQRYIKKTNRRVSYEYVMLKDINDSEIHARQLLAILKGQLCHINLIPYNATGIKGLAGSDRALIRRFRDIIRAAGIAVTIRVSLGQDIKAACGQLAGKHGAAKRSSASAK